MAAKPIPNLLTDATVEEMNADCAIGAANRERNAGASADSPTDGGISTAV